jgi:hypothetical protein
MPIPEGNHDDWRWPFNKIPRSLTAIESEYYPKKLLGNATGFLDVPNPGTWVLAWPPHWAYTTKDGDINRISIARFDYTDYYYQIGSLRLGSVTRFFKELFT